VNRFFKHAPIVLVFLTFISAAGAQPAQTPPARNPLNTAPQETPLWQGQAPGAQGNTDADTPTLTIYRAARGATGTGVVLAPGGGYGALAMDHEGRQVAAYFNAMGVSAFVLKYRLGPKYRHPIELGDAQRAMRLVRSRAQEYALQADRIGLMGFSAGGHLAATAGTRFDNGDPSAADPVERVSSRPDFLILGYPVITFETGVTHAGSVRNLIGENPDPKLIELLSNERHVTARTPPTFLFHTNADTGVKPENSVRFYLALRTASVPAEMHIFENGPHGVGLALGDPALGAWPVLLTNWLRARGLLTR
ncbi:MAG TPA: alpha/beta hydrolase, partial [Vicinamibacterales bacterium]|nr:alpha/beta hydrolase [Vicinamibacterales bacterium]